MRHVGTHRTDAYAAADLSIDYAARSPGASAKRAIGSDRATAQVVSKFARRAEYLRTTVDFVEALGLVPTACICAPAADVPAASPPRQSPANLLRMFVASSSKALRHRPQSKRICSS